MSAPLRVDPVWKGVPVVIVAGGASLSLAQIRLIGMARSRDVIRVIAVNDAVYPCWFADVAYACDARWWKLHNSLSGFHGLRVRLAVINKDGFDENPVKDPDIAYLIAAGGGGLATDPTTLHTGSNSGHQAFNLAIHLGTDRIILVGFDMKGSHWFGEHPEGVKQKFPPDHAKRIEFFRELKPDLRDRGVTVVNATLDTALDCFPKVSLETELKNLGGLQ